MGELKVFGMKAACDAIIEVAVKRTHDPQPIVGDLLQAGIGEKQAPSSRACRRIDPRPDDDRRFLLAA